MWPYPTFGCLDTSLKLFITPCIFSHVNACTFRKADQETNLACHAN